MATVILSIHILIALGLVGVVLMQKSEGGALGIGGGGGGGLLTGRGTTNLLSRITAILAAAFFVTSLALTMLAQKSAAPRSIFEQPVTGAPAADGKTGETAPVTPSRGGVLDRLQGTQGPAPAPVPATPGPATPAAPSTAPAAPTEPAVPQTR